MCILGSKSAYVASADYNSKGKCVQCVEDCMFKKIDDCDSSNGGHSGYKIFKPEKNLEFFRLKFWVQR